MKHHNAGILILALATASLLAPGAEVHDAAADEDATKLIKLLKSEPGLANSRDQRGNTPLIRAAGAGRIDAALLLLKNKAEVGGANNKGMSPLHVAKNKKMAELLIANGADVNLKADGDLTPLHIAVINGNKEVVEVLLANKANVNAKASRDIPEAHLLKGMTPLHLTLNGLGEKDICELLIAGGAELDATDRDGFTPLHWSIIKQNKEIAALLLTKKANVNAKTKEGRTPLDLAEDLSGDLQQLDTLIRAHGGKNGKAIP